jgi:5'-methylthioadenosine phosphorylase
MSTLKIGIIGGSGLGKALGEQFGGESVKVDTPFGAPSDAIMQGEWEGVPVCFLSRHGPGHLLNPGQVPYRANIFALKKLGCTHIIASGACGSLRDDFNPTDLVLADQVIDKTFRRAGTFFDAAAVHMEFAEPFCPVLRSVLLDAAKAMGESAERKITVHDRGCYVCMEGPAFSTRAESLMHRLWGGDLIGMTAMPEAKLAREAEISYALVAMVTDYDCWKKSKSPNPRFHESRWNCCRRCG